VEQDEQAAPAAVTPVRIVAADAVIAHLRERGASLNLWTDVHGLCEGKVTLLQVGMARPSDEGLRFERIGADGFDVFLAIARSCGPSSSSSSSTGARSGSEPAGAARPPWAEFGSAGHQPAVREHRTNREPEPQSQHLW
jgi:hypothetical protein